MNNNRQYIPAPIDTSDVVLPDEIIGLAETLAKNTHEVWAQGRLANGWTYGPVRSDELRQTPCLLPYDELPESEKTYDRSTSLETLKLIISLGYEIKPVQQEEGSGLPGKEEINEE